MDGLLDKHHRLLAELSARLGEPAVLTREADIAPFATDWRGRYHGMPLAVLRPGTRADVALAVNLVAAAGVAIVPQGGNTGLCGGATPCEGAGEVLLSLQRLNRVIELDRANATLSLEAGVTLAAAQAAAQEAGFLFPLSLAAEGSAQIGGNISTNAGGTAVLRYGNMRQLVLGLEVVLPDGRVWNGLRALRKDNTGYDLKQLFIGAEGTLGIITAAVLRLFPRPRASASAWLAVPTPTAALDVFAALRDALGDRLSGFELVSRVAVELVTRHIPNVRDPLPGHPWYLLVEADDSLDEPLEPKLEAALQVLIAAGSTSDAAVAKSQQQATQLWHLRESISEAQKREGLSIKHDISLPISCIPEFLGEAESALNAAFSGLRIVCFGHLGDGNLHYNLSLADSTRNAAFIAETPRINRIVHDLVAAHGGSISAEHGLGQLKREEIRRYKSPLEMELMQRIKSALDPMGLMNPGKLL